MTSGKPFAHDLPAHLADPADRLIAASALIYELTLITADRRLASLKNLSVVIN